MIKIFYKASEGASALIEQLNNVAVRKNTWRATKSGDILINWGRQDIHFIIHPNTRVFNHPVHIKNASNKLIAFKQFDFHSVPTLHFVRTKAEACEIINDGKIVIARTILNGSQGVGIVVCHTLEDLPDCSLYTEYMKPSSEIRVHVFNNEVIDYTQKKRRQGEETNPYIRNLENNWVFCREGVVRNETAISVAIKAVKALQLQFGAVDIIIRYDNAYVLEVNTAPGLTGTTLENYVNAIKKLSTPFQ